jgi:hypothetical protein
MQSRGVDRWELRKVLYTRPLPGVLMVTEAILILCRKVVIWDKQKKKEKEPWYTASQNRAGRAIKRVKLYNDVTVGKPPMT